MANPLFNNNFQSKNQSIFSLIQELKTGNAENIFNQMYQNNPEFRDFANSMRGKTPEQAFQEKGLNFNSFKDIIR